MRKCLLILFITFYLLLSTFCIAHADLNTAVDPTRLGVGARPLGMGKAYVGLAQGVESIFLNPAGLADLSTFEAFSMYGKFVSEINYISAGSTLPTNIGVLGIAMINAGLGINTPLAEYRVVDGEIRIIPSTTESTVYEYNNTVLLFSYARPVFKDLALGGNIKIFKTALTGFGATTADQASGMDLDLAVKYQPDSFYALGADLQNILPASLGGLLTYGDGYQEGIGSVIKLGSSFRIMGPEKALLKRPQRLMLNADYDLSIHGIPSLLHTGLEFSPVELLALRLGIDQDLVGIGSFANNLTAGVGLKLAGFRFDFAYHEYNNIPENTTYYFSLAYAPPPEALKNPFVILEPQNKFTTDEATIRTRGKVLELNKVQELLINNKKALFDMRGDFLKEVPLDLKLNNLRYVALGADRRSLKTETLKGLRLLKFEDVKPPYFAVWPVEYLATLGIITGYPDKTFRPEGSITRAEMCTLLMKARGVKGKTEKVNFKDLKPNHWAARYIAQAAQEGLVKGYPDKTFKPQGLITRAEGIAMISRFEKLIYGKILEAPFPDVPGRHWASREVQAAKEAGLLKYLEGRNLEPAKKLTRGLTAEILFRTSYVKKQIDKIWEEK
jgi:hypothetical protein